MTLDGSVATTRPWPKRSASIRAPTPGPQPITRTASVGFGSRRWIAARSISALPVAMTVDMIRPRIPSQAITSSRRCFIAVILKSEKVETSPRRSSSTCRYHEGFERPPSSAASPGERSVVQTRRHRAEVPFSSVTHHNWSSPGRASVASRSTSSLAASISSAVKTPVTWR